MTGKLGLKLLHHVSNSIMAEGIMIEVSGFEEGPGPFYTVLE